LSTQAEPAYIPDDDSLKINATIINDPPNVENVVESKQSNAVKVLGPDITMIIAIIVVLAIIVIALLIRNSRHKKHEHNKKT